MNQNLTCVDSLVLQAKSSLVHFKGVQNSAPLALECSFVARYVRLALQGSNCFHLNEVEIYDETGVNVALNKTVKTSSVFRGDDRWRGEEAVNGQKDGATGFHTDYEKSPWMEVDLGGALLLSKIVVYNRDDRSYLKAISLKVELSLDGESWTEVFNNYGILKHPQVQNLDEADQAIIHASILSFDLPRSLIDRMRACGQIDEANALHRKVNETVREYGFSLGHHGFVTSFDLMPSDRRQTILADTADVLRWLNDDFGVPAFISSGTLLGLIRDGKLLGHDDDIDLCYISNESEPEKIFAEQDRMKSFLESKGCRMNSSGLAHFWCNNASGFHFDLFPGFIEGTRCSMNPLRRRGVSIEDVLPVRKAKLEGIEVTIPSNPDAVLELNFGAGWRTPDPTWVFDWSHVTAEYRFLYPGARS